ncbi:MAG: thymidine phosphorylase [Ruminococcaceae bacterium]|nr:thymidine phosphorylase [Oscillospiraceae bacterium]
MRMVELIEKKRDGGKLSPAEIRFIVEGYTAGEIPDYQISALLMAIIFRGMDEEETLELTMAMAESGDMVDLSPLGDKTADKHSTGGVGDKTSLVLCPMVACCGVKMAKMSGRGLGHTGGTIDKLESFPGFSVSMSGERFMEIADTVGFVIAGQSGELAPADKKLYALRDVTGTVPAIPLIVSSIMSKKLASGAKSIVLDVKTGSGAFMATEEASFELARQMVAVGRRAGRNMSAVVTDMDQPLGFAVGNALEVKEAIAVLRGEDVSDLRELCLTLGAEILLNAGAAQSAEAARAKLEAVIADGSALDRLAAMVEAQGGDRRAVYDTSLLPAADVELEVPAEKGGYVSAIDARGVGRMSMMLGGGRATKESEIDLGVGVLLRKKNGDAVAAGETLAVIHARTAESAQKAAEALRACYSITAEKPQRPALIRGVVR